MPSQLVDPVLLVVRCRRYHLPHTTPCHAYRVICAPRMQPATPVPTPVRAAESQRTHGRVPHKEAFAEAMCRARGGMPCFCRCAHQRGAHSRSCRSLQYSHRWRCRPRSEPVPSVRMSTSHRACAHVSTETTQRQGGAGQHARVVGSPRRECRFSGSFLRADPRAGSFCRLNPSRVPAARAYLQCIHARGAGWPGPDGAAHVLMGPDGPAWTRVRGPGETKLLRAAQHAAKEAHVGVGWAPAEAVDTLLVVFQHHLLPLLVCFHTPYPHIRAGRCRGKPCAVTVPPERLDQLAVSLFDPIAWSHTAAIHP